MSSGDDGFPVLARRLRDGLERVASVLRADQWGAIEKGALNPTQAQILSFLAAAGEGGARVNAVAAHLCVSQPTATDSIAALEKKGLLVRRADAYDKRAVIVALTQAGRARACDVNAQPTATDRAIAALGEPDQSALLELLVALIRNLQLAGAVNPQRMCVTCKYFRPYAHKDPRAPHHCAFVDAPFGPSALRLDCAEHQAADLAAQADAWRIYENGRAEPDAARGAPP
jgi:DNA-binding MarR family transcriptional regulator